MKKFLYLCGMMLLCLNMMAQIDPYDRNWDTIVFDDFNDTTLQFDKTFQQPDHGQWRWISFSPRLHPSGVTKWSGKIRTNNYQAYQFDHCDIGEHDNLGVLKLFSDTIRCEPILCADLEDTNYYCLPQQGTFGKNYQCDLNNTGVRFKSGMIESIPWGYGPEQSEMKDQKKEHLHGRFRYGYFEIKLKSPIHRGAATGFWLWDVQDDYYEAIDIFEHTWDFTGPDGIAQLQGLSYVLGDPSVFSSGIKYCSYCGIDSLATECARRFPRIPDSEGNLSTWHTFSCEWLPESVTFYRDGQFISQEKDSIPSHPLALKTTYSIDRYIFDNYSTGTNLIWEGTDTMYVDYIKVLQLRCDCDTDEVIACQSDLNGFDYGVKKSISITSSLEAVKVADTCHVTFRSTDYFQITGPFQTDVGGELTVIMQTCPDNTVNYGPMTKKEEP